MTENPHKSPQHQRIGRIEGLIGLIATFLIIFGLTFYFLSEPTRLETAQAEQLQTDIDEAMTLYAENCSVCHGIAGEGIGSIPPLDSPGLRETDADTLSKILARGLYGTSMPAWSKEDGGPLSDYQINELVDLIHNENWDTVQDRVVNLGLAPLIPFAAEPDPEILEELAGIPGGDVLARGITLYAQECVACHGADGLGTSLAPAINDPEVRARSVDELKRTILYGVPGTLMAGWENVLTKDDIDAAIALITQWDQVPSEAIPSPDVPVPVTEESLVLGAELYTANCSRCHAPEGQGTQRAPSLNVKGYLEETSDQAIQQIVTMGVPDTSMPSWGDRMTDAEILAVVCFIRSWEPNAPEVAEPARGGGGPWWQTGASSPVGQSRGGRRWAKEGDQPPGMSAQSDSVLTEPDQDPEPLITPPTEIYTPQEGAVSPPEWTEQGQAVGSTNEQNHTDGTGGPPEWAGQGQAVGSSTEQNHTEGTGGPPWAQTQPALSWWEQLDLKAWGIILGSAAIALLLISVGFLGLRRLSTIKVK